MYIKLQRKDFLPVLSLCKNFISHFDSRDFAFLIPVRTSTLVATAKICIELLDCRTGPDPLAAGRGVRTPRDLLWRGGACFLGWSEVLCSRLAGSLPKAYTLHHPITSALVPGAGKLGVRTPFHEKGWLPKP